MYAVLDYEFKKGKIYQEITGNAPSSHKGSLTLRGKTDEKI